jgi:hypothetical protein
LKSNNKFSKSIKIHKAADRKLSVSKATGDEKDDGKEKETIYKFYSFKDRDFTFKYVRRLWANSSSYANSEDEESEESEEDM